MEINNKVLGIGTILMMAGLVFAAGSIWTDAAQIYMNNTVSVLGNLTVHNNDADDNFRVDVFEDKVYFGSEGGPMYLMQFDSEGDSTGNNMRLMVDRTDGGVGDSKINFFVNRTKTAGAFGYDDVLDAFVVNILDVGGGGQRFIPYTDNAYSLGINTRRWSTLYSQTLNTGDVVFKNNVTLTEAIDANGQRDIWFVAGVPSDNQIFKMGLYDIPDFAEFQRRHSEDDGTYAHDLTEALFIQYKAEVTGANGYPDFTFGRTKYLSIREVKNGLDRLDAIESETCGMNPEFTWC